MPTTNGIVAANAKPRDKVDAQALWLRGRLQDFASADDRGCCRTAHGFLGLQTMPRRWC